MRGIAAALIALLGCASETGIMVVITTAEGQASPDELIVYAGTKVDDLGESFSDPNADRFPVEDGRDLAADPVRYLIRPNEGGVVMVAAVGLGEQLDAPLTAHYTESLEFAPDVVLEVELVLSAGGGELLDECTLCYQGGDDFVISSQLDADCDGVLPAEARGECDEGDFTPPDCDDKDPARNAKQIESCDGIDNDCEEDNEEGVAVACFTDQEADSCRIGVQSCEGGVFGECDAPGDPEPEPELCDTLGDCQLSDDPIECFKDKAGERIVEHNCDVQIATTDGNGGQLCSVGPMFALPGLCTELVVLAVEGPANAAEAVNFGETGQPLIPGARRPCNQEPENLTLDGGLARGARYVLLERTGDAEPSAIHVVNLNPIYVATCEGGDETVTCR